MRQVVRIFGLGFVLVAATGCPKADDAVPTANARKCGLDVWVRPSARDAHVELVGSWNDFARPGQVVTRDAARADGWRTTHVDLAAGDYRYAFVEDGAWHPDVVIPTTAWEGDREVTWTHVEDCSAPELRIESIDRESDGASSIRLSFQAAVGAHGRLDPRSIAITTRTGDPVAAAVESDAAHGSIRVGLPKGERGKAVFLVSARDESGRIAPPVRASVWTHTPALTREDTVVYQIVLDRFEGNDGPLAPPPEPGARAGGRLKGVERAIERGDFGALGVNTLWISPVYKNPTGFFSSGEGRRFSAYHGYWPIDSRAVEPALGTEADLERLIAAAHARGIRVIFDVVPNHVHAEHPYWRDRKSDDGFNAPDGRCLCGQGDCPWATSIEKCWFAPYLPDLDTRHEDVLARTTDDVLFWLDRFEADGLRIDAVPMMPRSTTRRIAALARARFENPGHSLYLVGETFTNEGGFDALRYNLGPMGLDGQFHFPLMWALRKAIASESQGMPEIDAAIRAGEEAFAGSGAVMATMIGNHDVTRFASESDDTAAGDGFEPAPTPTNDAVFAKQKLALGILFALPGAPVVYYGDEVALPGRLDPDSRRVMPAESALSEAARGVRSFVRRVGTLRACSPLLRRGSYASLGADFETWSFARRSEQNTAALVMVARRPPKPGVATSVTIDPSVVPPGRYIDALDPATTVAVGKDGLTSVALSPFSLRIFLPEGDPCAASP